jgi:hypothetical protein
VEQEYREQQQSLRWAGDDDRGGAGDVANDGDEYGEYGGMDEGGAAVDEGGQQQLRRSADELLFSAGGDEEFGDNEPYGQDDEFQFQQANSPSRERGERGERGPTRGAAGEGMDLQEENQELKEENKMLREQLDSALEMVMRYKQLLKER